MDRFTAGWRIRAVKRSRSQRVGGEPAGEILHKACLCPPRRIWQFLYAPFIRRWGNRIPPYAEFASILLHFGKKFFAASIYGHTKIIFCIYCKGKVVFKPMRIKKFAASLRIRVDASSIVLAANNRFSRTRRQLAALRETIIAVSSSCEVH